MTRFEKTRIMGARALQLSMGAPEIFKTDTKEPLKIAEEEFEKNAIPIKARTRSITEKAK